MKIGCDIVEVSRIEKLAKNLNRVFTKSEINYASNYSNPYMHLAGAFAVKESIKKALDDELQEKFRFSSVELLHEDNGKPYVQFLEELQDDTKKLKIQVTISHTETLAMAFVIIE